MAYVIINGNRYDIPEMDFDAVCELEENGVNLMNMDRKNMKVASMTRGLVAWIMGVDIYTASKELEAHVKNGGNIIEIFTRATEAMQKSRFFNQNRPKQPQDHQTKQGGQNGKAIQYPRNRAQRRANKKNRGNGNHSQK